MDLDVSGKHASICRTPTGGWVVRDLGSTNGTFVNGRRVLGEVEIHGSDRISFGEHGPVVEFRERLSTATGVAPLARPASAPRTIRTRSASAGDSRSVAPRLSRATVTVGAVVVAAAFGLYAVVSRNAVLEGERAELQQRIDSLTVAAQSVESLQIELRELSDALQEARDEVAAATARLEAARSRGNPAEVSALRAQLDAAMSALGEREAAANLDFASIQRANRPAVALVYVEDTTGSISTGTAFAVRPDATLVTSRHVVTGDDGAGRPSRIAIQFSDSDQVWPARILAVSDAWDLAIVKVDNILGDVPTIRAFNLRPDTIAPGGVVASIGFPVGRDLTPGTSYGREGIVQPLVSAGIVGAVDEKVIEVRGYGSAGASGSPVFDARGAVIAVLFGGVRDAAHPVLLAVPATAVTDLLSTLP